MSTAEAMRGAALAGAVNPQADPQADPQAAARAPGALAGVPTAYDVVGRSLVALRAQIVGAIASLEALSAQVDVAMSALVALTPPEDRAKIRRAATQDPAPGRDGGTPEKPRTFMDTRTAGGNDGG